MNMLYPFFAIVIWAMNVVITKMAVGSIEPAVIAFYRWFLALLVLTPFLLKRVIRNKKIIYEHWWKLMISGLLGMVLFQSLTYYAAHSVSAMFIGIFSSLVPLLTILISLFVLKTSPTLKILLGSLLSFIGLIYLVSEGHPAQLSKEGIGKGELMMFCATASYALYGVLTKRWMIPLPHSQSLYIQIQIAFGVLILLPDFLLSSTLQLNAQNIPLVLFAGIPASILAPYFWILGVTRLGANTTSIFMNLLPVFTAIIVVIVLHEKLSSYHYIGGGITLIGMILAQNLRFKFKKEIQISKLKTK